MEQTFSVKAQIHFEICYFSQNSCSTFEINNVFLCMTTRDNIQSHLKKTLVGYWINPF